MGKFLKVVGMILLSIVIVGGVAGYFFVKNFDLNKYKSFAEKIVEEQIGRKLVINGNASVGISLIPTIIVQDVELANAPWATEPQMIKVQSLELKFALLPLLKKQIVIDKIAIIQPQIFLETAKNGKNNWEFDKPVKNVDIEKVLEQKNVMLPEQKQELIETTKQESTNAGLAVLAGFAAKNVSIENGLVQINDQKSGTITKVEINDITMSANSFYEDINAAFDVVYDGQVIKGKTTLGPIDTLLSNKAPYPVNLTVMAMGLNVALNGTINDMMNDLSVMADVNVYNPAGNLGAPETTLKSFVEGNMKKVTADIKLLNVVTNVITGKVSADISGKIPLITADLRSDLINLETFNQNSSFAFVLPSLIGEAQASPLVPNTPVPYAEMLKVNAKADLDIKKLIIQPGMEANNVLLKANLQNGVLNVNPLQLNFGGGDIKADMSVDAAAQKIVLNALSQNMLLQNLHKEFMAAGKGDFGIISGGNTEIKVNLVANGETYRQLVQSLNGQAIVILNKSVVQTGSLSFISGNFLSQLLSVIPFTKKANQEVDVNCAVVRADLGGGKAVFPKGIALDSSQMNLVSNGTINLINDKIDFSVHPFSGKVVDTNVAQALSSFIKVKGTIEEPKIAIDDAQALKAIVGVATTGPAYLGSSLLLDADSAPCHTALAGTVYKDVFPAATGVQAMGQDVYKDTSKTVDDSVKVLKGTAKDAAKDLEGAAKDIINIFKNKRF